MSITGPAAEALKGLTPTQLSFIQNLPKAELHAHLNGSIPISVLQELARDHLASASISPASVSNYEIQSGIDTLLKGPSINEISDFFTLFPAIYALMSTPLALARGVRAVLSLFLDGEHPQCTYLELRTTPKETKHMSREEYLRVVLNQLKSQDYNGRVGLIVSMDRRMSQEVLAECVGLAKKLKMEKEPVVGVDLCGDPFAGDMKLFKKHFHDAKDAGLGVTLHIAETAQNPPQETLELLSFAPDRLGHATFLDEDAKKIVADQNTCIEICLSSNLLCKTVSTLDAHHIRHYLKERHPIVICTDDVLPFRTSLIGEYALLMAPQPLGLGLSEEEVRTVAQMSMDCRFATYREEIMDLGSNFSAKLEPFLLMGKGLKGAAAAKLIQDATSAPGVFVFSELLELPNIQELGKSEQYDKSLSLLQLFSYRSYQDYIEYKNKLPPLNEAQTIKLKHLSIVSLAADRRILPYADLLKALDMPTIRELEDLIIDAIYLDILRGKLDQKEQQLEVEYTMGRDLEPGKLEEVLAALQNWAETTSSVLATLDAKIQLISLESEAAKKAELEHEKALQANLKEVFEKSKDKALGGGGIMNRRGAQQQPMTSFSDTRDSMHMDVDENPENSKSKNRK
ncbi:hypothetical protein H0H87_010625 [Tephrocybe sp. NHM501043]|nr:hypothetical protein H0H87_010625 [Tephrocybe sp. NHM501043]